MRSGIRGERVHSGDGGSGVGEVEETVPPTEEQKRIMHELDPAGLIVGR